MISEDAKLVTSLTKTFGPGTQFAEYEAKYPSSRFAIEKWGKRGLIILDLKSGPISSLQTNVDVGVAALAAAGEDGTFRLGDLPPDQKALIESYFSQHRPQAMRPEGFNMDDACLGLGSSLSVSFRGPSRSDPVTIQMPTSNDASHKRDLTLAKHPIPSNRPSDEERRKINEAAQAADLSRGLLAMHLFGYADEQLPDGMREAAKLIESVEKKLRDKGAETIAKIQKKLGLKGDELPGTASSFSELPDALKQSLSARMSSDWQALGFGSEAEAQSFLQNSGSIRLTTWAGLVHCQNPGDPAHHLPGAYGGYMFGSSPGGIGP